MLDDSEARARLSANARVFAQENFDLKTICLPQQLAWVQALSGIELIALDEVLLPNQLSGTLKKPRLWVEAFHGTSSVV